MSKPRGHERSGIIRKKNKTTVEKLTTSTSQQSNII